MGSGGPGCSLDFLLPLNCSMIVARRTLLAMLPAAALLGCAVSTSDVPEAPAVLRIEPATVTVRQGTGQQFRTFVGATELRDVEWSVRDSRGQPPPGGGTISASGVYVPGPTTGKWFFVHAVAAGPKLTAVAQVEVVSAAQAVQTWCEALQDGWVLRWSDAAIADAERIRDLVALSLQQLSELFRAHGGDQLWRPLRLTVHVHAFPEDGAAVGTMTIVTDGAGAADVHLLAPSAHGTAGADGWAPGYDRTYFHKNLVHELSTVFCEQVARRKNGGFDFHSAPPWFVQGIEEYVGCRLANDDHRLRQYLDAVRRDPSRVGLDFSVRDVYSDGCVLVWFLRETLGEAPLLAVLANRAPDFWQALQEAAGASRAEIHARWLQWLQRDREPLPR